MLKLIFKASTTHTRSSTEKLSDLCVLNSSINWHILQQAQTYL